MTARWTTAHVPPALRPISVGWAPGWIESGGAEPCGRQGPVGRGRWALPDAATVTVVTRTQDRPILLDRAVRSVMQQTLGNLQMVIVNDGGDSGTVEELLEARRDQVQGRAKVVHHEAPRGMEEAGEMAVVLVCNRCPQREILPVR